MTEKLENLLKDEAILAKLEQADDETLVKILSEHGIDIEAECKNAEIPESADGELDLDALDCVAGGKKTAGYWLRRIIFGKKSADKWEKATSNANDFYSKVYGN